MEKKLCISCVHFEKEPFIENDNSGLCKRNAPTGEFACWPRVRSNLWCSQHSECYSSVEDSLREISGAIQDIRAELLDDVTVIEMKNTVDEISKTIEKIAYPDG